MDTLELSASTLDDAAAQAAAEWGVDPKDIKLTVLEETKGLFGKPGKLKVRAEKPSAPKGKAKAAKAAPAPAPAPVVEEEEAAAPAPVEEAPAKPAKKGRAPKKEAPKVEAEVEAEAPAEEEASHSGEEVVASQAEADQMVGILNNLFAMGDLEATAQISSLQGKYVNVEIDGKDTSFLVGRRGEVLNALQYLCNVIASRQIGTGIRIVIDGNSYRKRREQVLYKLATDIAVEVRERGEEAVLDALPAFERRIVHQALQEFEGVSTYSEGEEPNRRVVIAPAE